jgi:hypothetical protein
MVPGMKSAYGNTLYQKMWQLSPKFIHPEETRMTLLRGIQKREAFSP